MSNSPLNQCDNIPSLNSDVQDKDNNSLPITPSYYSLNMSTETDILIDFNNGIALDPIGTVSDKSTSITENMSISTVNNSSLPSTSSVRSQFENGKKHIIQPVLDLTLDESTSVTENMSIFTVNNSSLPSTSSVGNKFENGEVSVQNDNTCQIGKKHKLKPDYEYIKSKITKLESQCNDLMQLSELMTNKLDSNSSHYTSQLNLLETKFSRPTRLAVANHTIISSEFDDYNDINKPANKLLEVPDQSCLSKDNRCDMLNVFQRPFTEHLLVGKEKQLFDQLLEMFPDIDQFFLKKYCSLGLDLEQMVDYILKMNNYYPKSYSDKPTMLTQGNNNFQVSNSTNIHKGLDNSLGLPPSNRDALKTISELDELSFNMNIDNLGRSRSMDIQGIMTDISSPSPAATGKTENSSDYNENFIHNISVNKEPNRDSSISRQFDFLSNIFPDADRSFLEEQCLLGERDLETFILNAMEKRNYPKAVNQPKTEETDLGLFTGTDFNIDHFLKIFPDPVKYFMNESRSCKYDEHSVTFLKRRYRLHSVKAINSTYRQFQYNLSKTCEALDNAPESRVSKRGSCEIRMPTSTNIHFLQEACFIEHTAEIKAYFNRITKEREIAYKEAEEKGELIECGCCYSQVLFEECAACNEGDLFCKPCIQQSAEVRVGDGHTTFPCLSDCGSNFSIHLLQKLIDARMFSRLLQRIQLAEVKAADIEGLEICPFCEFATIPPPDTILFNCLNPECLIESCRKCHKKNHIPVRCEEVESDDQEKARKFIEDEMTKALVRECYKCKKNFIKTDGCNKMTCTCGAKMCYICRQPITDYKHFNGAGGSELNKCPLYSSDQVLHVEAVKAVAKKALEEVGQKNPELKLVHDPTKILPPQAKRTVPAGVNERIDHVLDLVCQNIAGLQQTLAGRK